MLKVQNRFFSLALFQPKIIPDFALQTILPNLARIRGYKFGQLNPTVWKLWAFMAILNLQIKAEWIDRALEGINLLEVTRIWRKIFNEYYYRLFKEVEKVVINFTIVGCHIFGTSFWHQIKIDISWPIGENKKKDWWSLSLTLLRFILFNHAEKRRISQNLKSQIITIFENFRFK